MKKKILVTGASGLIGSNLVDELLKNDYFVIGLANTFLLKKYNIEQFNNINYVQELGDITDQFFLSEICSKHKPDFIVHLAAQAIVDIGVSSPQHTFDVNLRGTWNILEEAIKLPNLKRLVVASSDKAYGTHEKLPYKEDFELKAVFPYDISKKMTEELAMSYFHTYGLPIVITRCGNVFGPYDLNESRIVPGSIMAVLSNEKIVLRSDGKQKRCYVYSKDVVDAYLKILEAPSEKVIGEAFNIGNDKHYSVLEIVNTICELCGKESKNEIIIRNTSKFEIKDQYLDCSKANEVLFWKAKYSLSEALDETIKWYSKNFSIVKNHISREN